MRADNAEQSGERIRNMTNDELRAAVDAITIEPVSQVYYDREEPIALVSAFEQINEWDYAEDPHGYCHSRTTLTGLVKEIAGLREENARLAASRG